ncbi:putative membrane protein [Rosellinia necatrix]|uniref:Putative membrane protein n=1 Tax=Rosellinia necatrix TaxID=77044 RepID=A0A1W2TC72_ROSNE|nr:putative membrane protein [Rosellinia necatrix]
MTSTTAPPPPPAAPAPPRSPLTPRAMPPAPAPLLLTVRFSASLPDLELDIPRPGATTVVSLKHLIRSRLDKGHARRRLRFIHGGKILPDTAALSAVLRALPPPPPTTGNSPHHPSPPPPLLSSQPNLDRRRSAEKGGRGGEGEEEGEGRSSKSHSKGKGKSVPGRPEPAPRIYVNCSIGDELSTAELEREAQAAALPPPTSSFPHHHHPPAITTATTTTTSSSSPGPDPSAVTTSAAPRGFDRLLSAGFTASEVSQLRLQFRGIHAARYTPDTLPSPDGFRRMEDAWIDDNGAAVPAAAAATTGAAHGGGGGGSGGGGGGGMLGMAVVDGTDSDEFGLVGMVDVLVRGVITGFIWPLGSAGWLMREEGMSSDRWRFMVGVGVVFGILIGLIRAISGDK